MFRKEQIELFKIHRFHDGDFVVSKDVADKIESLMNDVEGNTLLIELIAKCILREDIPYELMIKILRNPDEDAEITNINTKVISPIEVDIYEKDYE